ncbi:MAG: response regulator [Rivularia sp. (in: cyanobacteria)]
MIDYNFQNNPPLILVVDDERALRLVLRKAMEKKGYTVIEACDTRHCLDICQQQLPDLILLDAMIPGSDGFSCCEQVQALLQDCCPPILMITSLNKQEAVDKAVKAGATDYITKPINWNLLDRRVDRLLLTRWGNPELKKKIQRECLLTLGLEAGSRKLQNYASVDKQTQIANRDYFDQYLEREWNRLQKYQLSLSLIFVKVNFTKVDNIASYPDKYIIEIIDTIGKCKGKNTNLLARFDDETFCVILSKTESEAASDIGKAILRDLEALKLSYDTTIGEFINFRLFVTTVIPNSELSAKKTIAKAKTAFSQLTESNSDFTIQCDTSISVF